MKKTIATMCLMSLLTITMPVQALTVKDGVDIEKLLSLLPVHLLPVNTAIVS